MHEPAASQLAVLAECAGEAGGLEVYWRTISWIYQHTQGKGLGLPDGIRSEEHTSELQSLMRISYAVFCLKKKTIDSPTLVWVKEEDDITRDGNDASATPVQKITIYTKQN